ncbi:Uma2 family endonuclease [Microcoleus sp. herbarium5]|uniref:Uma2 family endonuclease n=1 Tax=Microcoleus sp. herbarium5 TaxID=3055434 RepID=UPI002FD58CF7
MPINITSYKVEILSPPTEVFDRGDKLANYRSLLTIQEYVLIGQQRMNVDCYRRDVAGSWVFSSYREGDCLEFASINFQCLISAEYEDVP